MPRKGHSPEKIANYFLDLARERGIALTPMHLQKLVYIAHGWSLALMDRELVDREPEAWRWGPVYPTLYNNTKKYGAEPVFEPIYERNWAVYPRARGFLAIGSFDDDERALMNAVFENYGDLKAFQLSALTHNDGTPWSDVYKSGGWNENIPNEKIKAHFLELASRDVSTF